MERDERQRRAQIRRRRRKRQILIGYILIILLILIILGIAGVLAKDMLEKRGIQIPEVSIPWISSWMAGEESTDAGTGDRSSTDRGCDGFGGRDRIGRSRQAGCSV